MFTGIIEEQGEVLAWEPSSDAARMTVRAPLAASDARHGDSIAVSADWSATRLFWKSTTTRDGSSSTLNISANPAAGKTTEDSTEDRDTAPASAQTGGTSSSTVVVL